MAEVSAGTDAAILNAVARLEAKVDLLIVTQKEIKTDVNHLDDRLRQVETKIARLEADSTSRKSWPNVVSAVVAVVALAITFVTLLNK